MCRNITKEERKQIAANYKEVIKSEAKKILNEQLGRTDFEQWDRKLIIDTNKGTFINLNYLDHYKGK